MSGETETERVIKEANRLFDNLKISLFKEIGDELGCKIDAVHKKIDSMNDKLARLETKFENVEKIEKKVDDLQARMGKAEGSINVLEATVSSGNKDISKIGDRAWTVIMSILSVVITGMLAYHSFTQ